ncbi:MAG TPA: hypothetical protein GX002_01660 [Clostridiales bacterium]|jgi:hypothetical protein|nr:hypothetical protein [Clostridiales bacterium]
MKAYQFRIEIKNSKPPIWRRCIVPAGITFSQLSVVLDMVMGWSGYHWSKFEFYHLGLELKEDDELFDFVPFGEYSLLDSSRTYIDEYMEKQNLFTYTYDIGDKWTHRVTIENVIMDYPYNYPKVIKYKEDTPIEDCGGIYGYYKCLEIMADEKHPENKEIREWADMQGYNLKYNMDIVNNELRRQCFINYCKADKRKKHEIYNDMLYGKYGLTGSKTAKNTMKPIEPIQNNDIAIKPSFEDQIRKLARNKELYEKIENIKNSGLEVEAIDNVIKLEINDALARMLIKEGLLDGFYLIDNLKSYTKAELKDIADIFCMSKISALNKDDLKQAIVEKMLTPEVLRDAFLKLGDDEIHAFEKAAAYTVGYTVSEEDVILYSELFDMGYIHISMDNTVRVPHDVAHVYNQINNEKFQKQRKRISWLLSCFETAASLYGVVPINIMIRLYNQRKGKKTDWQTLSSDFEQIPYMHKKFELIDNIFIYDELLYGSDHYTKLLKIQGDKEFYIPTENEIIEISRYGFILHNPHMDEFISLLNQHNILFGEEAVMMAAIINEIINSGGDISDVFDTLDKRRVIFNSKDILAKFVSILNNVWNNTRMLYNRGHKPAELYNKENQLYGAARPMPTIVPGSSKAAKILIEGKEELNSMGFNVDLDINAEEIPVYSMPSGIDGTIRKETKKIYPNDPCPCGSGKKYKRCCGR